MWRGGGNRAKTKHTAPGIRKTQQSLRRLALQLAQGDDPRLRRKIRRHLEVISLLYASKALDGEEFRRSAALAVDLSGYRLEQSEKIKRKAKKLEARAAQMERKRAVSVEQAERPLEETF